MDEKKFFMFIIGFLFSVIFIPNVFSVSCGNSVCETGETQRNCCRDCKCPSGFFCYENVCRKTENYIINVTEDTWVTSRYGGDDNYGGDGGINKEATCNEFWTWVKFDNTKLPNYPLNSSILCFECYYKANRFDNGLNLYNATNNWTEMTLIYNNMPSLGSQWTGLGIGISRYDYCPKTYCVNVTAPVLNARNRNMTIVLHSTGSCSATDPCYFKSKEYGGGVNPPKIIHNLILPASCGDGFCQPDENSDNCCLDCGCPSGFDCIDNGCWGVLGYTLKDVGQGIGNLFLGMSPALILFIILLAFGTGIGYLLSQLSKGIEKKI